MCSTIRLVASWTWVINMARVTQVPRSVTVIPATIIPGTYLPKALERRRKVPGYVCVSTDIGFRRQMVFTVFTGKPVAAVIRLYPSPSCCNFMIWLRSKSFIRTLLSGGQLYPHNTATAEGVFYRGQRKNYSGQVVDNNTAVGRSWLYNDLNWGLGVRAFPK